MRKTTVEQPVNRRDKGDSKKESAAGRRKFLKAAGLAGAAAAATIAMPQVSRAQTTTLKMQGSWGAKDVFNEFAQDYVERVNAFARNAAVQYVAAYQTRGDGRWSPTTTAHNRSV